MNRWLVVVGISALAVAGVLSACGDDDNDDNGDPTVTSSPAPAEVQLTEPDNGTTVTLAADGTLIVALASNPSTGYSWAIVSPEPEFLELDGEPKFVPAGSTTPVVGAGGTQVFTLKATGAGTSTLMMEYNRTTTPPEEPEETFTVTVVTK
jgi:predicted secreted protein